MALYAPIIKGEIEGFKAALTQLLSPWEHSRKLELEEHEGEWLVGFGMGLQKGIVLKAKLTEGIATEVAEMRIACILFMLDRLSYDKFEQALSHYIDHLDSWDDLQLTEELAREVEELIHKNRLQRALEAIAVFYDKKFALNALRLFSKLPNALSGLRFQKSQNQVSPDEYTAIKEKIQADLAAWVDKYR